MNILSGALIGRFCLLLLCVPITTMSRCYAQSISSVWVADDGEGNYQNPVLHADYSDPDAIRVGKAYYMVASSFHCMPGLPILKSRDLVNWRLVNHAVRRLLPDTVYNFPRHGKGIWAPAIRYHYIQYFIFYPDPDYGIFMIKARDPEKKWSVPKLVLEGKGIIDPCPLWDDNGQAYLAVAWAASRAGVNSLLTIYPLSKDGSKITGEGQHVYDGHRSNHTIEGPKLYKRNGYYYIFAPAGGVSTGWQEILRSKNIYGPYEQKKFLEQGKTRNI